MKHKFIAFMDSLILYDYILFGSIFLIFILLVILALVLRKKVGLSVFLIIFAFIFLFVAPFVGYVQMHNMIFKKELTLVSKKKLQFTKAAVVFGKLKNTSNRDFESCLITAIATKKTKNKYKNYIFRLKPIMKMSIVKEDIVKGNEIEFKIIIDPFTYTKDFDIILEADCI